jgi:hypothetical protein
MTSVPEGFENWTLDEKSAHWDKQRKKDRSERQKGIDKLSQEQRDAVKEAYEALSAAMMSLHECQDLWLSDVKKMDESMWQLRRLFNLEGKDD